MSLDNKKDMLKKKCKKCKKGKYYEWHFLCDRGDYPLRCGNCDHETQRWVEKKKKKKAKTGIQGLRYFGSSFESFYDTEIENPTKPFKETVVERLLKDKKFKQHLEIEISDAILKGDYYAAHIMLKDLVEYKERKNTGG